jgi:hypothetical protein
MDRAQAIHTLSGLFEVLAAVAKDLPRDDFDPRTVISAVGKEPAKLAEWVREHTRWIPYRGMLRGARGVLMDRQGNALDRSLLLAELLRLAGYQVRLAHAMLPQADAAKLLKKMPLAAPNPKATSRDDASLQPTLDARARQASIDPKLIENGTVKSQLRVQRATQQVIYRSAEQTPALAALVAPPSAGAAAAPARAPEQQELLDAVADHWWVQYTVPGSNAPSTLDIMLSDPGAQAFTATQTVSPGSDQRFAISDDEAHSVELRVVIERWQQGTLSTATLLKDTLRPADVLGKRIALTHYPMDWPDMLDLSKEPDPAGKLREVVAKPREWVPVLSIGKQTITQAGLLDDGTIDETPHLGASGEVGGGVAKAGNAVTDLFGGPDADAPKAPAGAVTAEWIEYEIRTPGKPAQTVRREVFDLLGPHQRGQQSISPRPKPPALTDAQRVDRGLAFLGTTEVLLQPCAVPQSWVDYLAVAGLLRNRKLIMDLTENPPADAASLKKAIEAIEPAPGQVYSLACARFSWSPVGPSVYLDRVNVLAEHTALVPNPSASRGTSGADATTPPFVLSDALDIVSNPVAVRSGMAGDRFKIRMEQGIADTATESAIVAEAAPAHVSNTSDRFAASLAVRRPWIVLNRGDDSKLASLKLDSDNQARIQEELASGRQVVASGEASDGAWWSIDPATGQTLGMGPHGWGVAIPESASIILQFVAKVGVAFACGYMSHSATVTVLCVLTYQVGLVGLAAGGTVGGVISALADILSIFGTIASK